MLQIECVGIIPRVESPTQKSTNRKIHKRVILSDADDPTHPGFAALYWGSGGWLVV